jgi:hypothetical protein
MLVVVAVVDKDQQDQVELVVAEMQDQVLAQKLEQLIQVVEVVVNLEDVIQDLQMQVVQV